MRKELGRKAQVGFFEFRVTQMEQMRLHGQEFRQREALRHLWLIDVRLKGIDNKGQY